MASAALKTRPDSPMPPKPARFPRSARLLRHADFERVYKQGRRHFSSTITVFYWPRPEVREETRPGESAPQGLRVGFTVGRALGGAVQRNRMKRRLREAVRLTRPPAGIPADVVINPKKSVLKVEFAELEKEIGRAVEVIQKSIQTKAGE